MRSRRAEVCRGDRTTMRTFARNKKARPASGGAEAAAATSELLSVQARSPIRAQKHAPAQQGGKGTRPGHSAAHAAQPDPYAFDIGDDLAAPDEGSQHDPAFLGSLVARSGASLDGDDGSLHSASPPEQQSGRGPVTFKGALARLSNGFPKLNRFATHRSMLT